MICSQTACRGARTTIEELILTRPASADHRHAALGDEPVEGVLHDRGDVLVDLVDVGVGAEAGLEVDRREDVDR